MENELKLCPFCGEADFDLIGLKHHLLSGFCEIFEKTQTIKQETEEKDADEK